jgi:hypothetical protein
VKAKRRAITTLNAFSESRIHKDRRVILPDRYPMLMRLV